MSDFERQERYIVVKRRQLTPFDEQTLRMWIAKFGASPVECVVVESDWPIYEAVWDMIQRQVEGRQQELEERYSELDQLCLHASRLESYVANLRNVAQTMLVAYQRALGPFECDECGGQCYQTLDQISPVTELRKALEMTPENSLALRDARKQIEILRRLDSMAPDWDTGSWRDQVEALISELQGEL